VTTDPADPPSPLTAAGKKLLEILMIQARHVGLADALTQDFPARSGAGPVEGALPDGRQHRGCDGRSMGITVKERSVNEEEGGSALDWHILTASLLVISVALSAITIVLTLAAVREWAAGC